MEISTSTNRSISFLTSSPCKNCSIQGITLLKVLVVVAITAVIYLEFATDLSFILSSSLLLSPSASSLSNSTSLRNKTIVTSWERRYNESSAYGSGTSDIDGRGRQGEKATIGHMHKMVESSSYCSNKNNAKMPSCALDKLLQLCLETNNIVEVVYKTHISHEVDKWFWDSGDRIHTLTCSQLLRSIGMDLDEFIDALSAASMQIGNSTVVEDIVDESTRTALNISTGIYSFFDQDNFMRQSFYRLSEKIPKLKINVDHYDDQVTTNMALNATTPLKILVLGGSMTVGFQDYRPLKGNTKLTAWPQKLEQFLHYKFGNQSVQVINIAEGGANEDTWLGKIHEVIKYEPIDLILVELSVNDQTDYSMQESKQKMVHSTSNLLLNILSQLPSNPAIFTVEMFRTAYGNERDARKHCSGYIQEVINVNDTMRCLYCPQWWNPQDWRKAARDLNSVSYISYRDAVWPQYHYPPSDLCYSYWPGLSHPRANVHAMVASSVFFLMMITFEMRFDFLKRWSIQHEADIAPEALNTSAKEALLNATCLFPLSSFQSKQGDPHDPLNIAATMSDRSCWKFDEDSKEKYGWICSIFRNSTHSNSNELNGTSIDYKYLRFYEKVKIGRKKLVIISRLVSYDQIMAVAQIWFSGMDDNETINIFTNDPIWNISSWHNESTSVPKPFIINLNNLQLKNSTWNASLNSDEGLDVTLNIMMLPGTSLNSEKQPLTGKDKFKLLGVTSC